MSKWHIGQCDPENQLHFKVDKFVILWKKTLKIRVFNHGTNVGHRFAQKCTTPPPPPDSQSHFSYEIFVMVKNHKSFSLCSQGAWRARHSEHVSAHPKQTQRGAYFRDAPLQGHYPTSKCTRFYFLFFNFHFFSYDTHRDSRPGNDYIKKGWAFWKVKH